MNHGRTCESDLSFDLLLAGHLADADAQRVRAHVAGCDRCAARWTQLRGLRDAFDAARPPLDLGPPLLRSPWWRSRWLAPAAALAAAAMLMLVVWPESEPAPSTRTKGNRVFQVYIRHGEAIRIAGDVEVVYPGDQLQLLYTSPRSGFAALLSRDGAGVASVYFPDGERTAWPVPAGFDESLPRSTILDDTTGQETIHALFCVSAIELEPLRADLAAGRALRVPPGCLVESTQLDKRAAP